MHQAPHAWRREPSRVPISGRSRGSGPLESKSRLGEIPNKCDLRRGSLGSSLPSGSAASCQALALQLARKCLTSCQNLCKSLFGKFPLITNQCRLIGTHYGSRDHARQHGVFGACQSHDHEKLTVGGGQEHGQSSAYLAKICQDMR